MIRTSIFALAILFTACNTPSDSTGDSSTKDNSAAETIIDAPTVNVTPEQLVGIWEITEIRSNPNVKGSAPDMMNKGIIFGFTDDARMSTTSLGIEYMRESLEYSTMGYMIEKGVIRSIDDNSIFELQWGEEGIRVVKIGNDELCLWYKMLGSKKDKYAYLKRAS